MIILINEIGNVIRPRNWHLNNKNRKQKGQKMEAEQTLKELIVKMWLNNLTLKFNISIFQEGSALLENINWRKWRISFYRANKLVIIFTRVVPCADKRVIIHFKMNHFGGICRLVLYWSQYEFDEMNTCRLDETNKLRPCETCSGFILENASVCICLQYAMY